MIEEMEIAKRVVSMAPSRTLALKAQADSLAAKGEDIVDLGVGQPDFDVPAPFLDAMIAALKAGKTRYSAAKGLGTLRKILAQRYKRKWGASGDPEGVLISAGAKSALFHLIGATVNPGDEVIIPSPYWVSYPAMVQIWGGVPRFLPTQEDSGFLPTPEDLEDRIREGTKGLILNSPCNPSGAVIPKESLVKIVEIAAEHKLWIIFDECYEPYVYENAKHISLPAIWGPLKGRGAVVHSGSKIFATTGLRIGWAVADPKWIAKAGTIQSHSISNVPVATQEGLIAALAQEKELFEGILERYDERRKIIIAGLNSVPGLRPITPHGGFFIMVEAFGLMRKLGFLDTETLSQHLLKEAGVLTIPGSAFGQEGYLRLSYPLAPERIQLGMDRLRKAAEQPPN